MSIMQKYVLSKFEAECPVCNARDASLLWSVNCAEAAQHFVLKELHQEKFLALSAHIALLWGQENCDVVRCNNCHFCYSYPYVAGDEQFYTLAYERSGYPAWKWEFQLTYEVLRKFPAEKLRLLEVGAGNGTFIKRVAGQLIPKEQIISTEFSEYGRLEIGKLGVKCYPTDVRNLQGIEFEQALDVICMFQVLEHMDKLDILLPKLNAMMKQGGSLFVAVPNPFRIEFNEMNGALLDMPPNHIGRWNIDSFKEIGSHYGFSIADYQIEKTVFVPMIKQFINYRFLRNSHRAGSLENRALAIKSRYARKAMQLTALVINTILSLPALVKMNNDMGNSMWVHFVKSK